MADGRYSDLKRLLEQGLAEAREKVSAKFAEVRSFGYENKSRPSLMSGDGDVSGLDPDVDLKLLEMDSDEVKKYLDALSRLNTGDYGVCSDCGEEIPVRRLEALAFAVRCRSCQEVEELSKNSSVKHDYGVYLDE